MRLWHKDLIDVLPRQQLVAQWRECCGIARNIAVEGSPNHILVNRIADYPFEEFWAYTRLVYLEMQRRGYKCNFYDFAKWFSEPKLMEMDFLEAKVVDPIDIFQQWHTKRYLWQCYANLEEKYDCGGIPEEEWILVEDRMRKVVGV